MRLLIDADPLQAAEADVPVHGCSTGSKFHPSGRTTQRPNIAWNESDHNKTKLGVMC
jgi:hypothetical protein